MNKVYLGLSNDLAAPSVCVIVPTYNGWKMSQQCLNSLEELTYSNFSLCVVDNGSSDETVRMVQTLFPDVDLVVSKTNLGFAAGVNLGLRRAIETGTTYSFLVNNDTTLTKDVLDALVQFAERNLDYAALTPCIRFAQPPYAVWSVGCQRHPLTQDVAGWESRPLPNLEYPREVDFVFGTALLLRNVALERVGLFDERYFMYYEDMDLSVRIREAGFKLAYVPGGTVFHHVAGSTAENLPVRYYHKACSSTIYYLSHTRGWHWLIIVPYRLGSAIRTLCGLVWRGRFQEAWAYVRGTVEGFCLAFHLTSR